MRNSLKSLTSADKTIPHSSYFQQIGDIAILSLPPEAQDTNTELAIALMARHKTVKKVLNKVTKLEGDRRVAGFEILVGEGTETVHRENCFIYRLDVTRTFFSSRLSFEHARIASQVCPGETVLVPFAGVGPFAIPLAAQGAQVLAVEKNPDACRYLQENSRLNGVAENITIVRGDAFLAAEMLAAKFDRAVIPTPYGMDHILERILPIVRSEGMLHFYTFKKKYQIPELVEMYERMGLQVRLSRRCGNVAPGVSRWAFDLFKC
jgi:tRNA (guanine37-N1)-methyltransferase